MITCRFPKCSRDVENELFPVCIFHENEVEAVHASVDGNDTTVSVTFRGESRTVQTETHHHGDSLND